MMWLLSTIESNQKKIKRLVSMCIFAPLVLLLFRQKLEGKKASRLKIEPTEDEKANLRGKWGDSDHFEDVVMWFADNIKPFYNGTFPIWSKIQSELK